MGQKIKMWAGHWGMGPVLPHCSFYSCLHFLGFWFPSQTQRQPQKCPALPQSICVLLIQCSGLGHLFPRGTCFSIVCWFIASPPAGPVCTMAAWCLVVGPGLHFLPLLNMLSSLLRGTENRGWHSLALEELGSHATCHTAGKTQSSNAPPVPTIAFFLL